MVKSRILSCTAAALVSGAAIGAHAQTAPESSAPDSARTMRVAYADLDLASLSGQRALQGRVRAAAEAVCGPAPSLAEMARHALYRSCVRNAEGGVAAQMLQAIADASTRTRVIHTAMVGATGR